MLNPDINMDLFSETEDTFGVCENCKVKLNGIKSILLGYSHDGFSLCYPCAFEYATLIVNETKPK